MATNEQDTASKFVGTNTFANAEIHSIALTKYVFGDKKTTDGILGDLVKLEITENIFQKFLSGSLVFNDRTRLIEGSPMVGDETLEIEFRSKITELVNKQTFVITKATMQKQTAGDKQYYIVLEFSNEKISNFYTEYSTSFADKPISEYVKSFLTDVIGLKDKNMKIETTDGNFTFAFPYQKPTFIFDYLNEFAKSTTGGIYYLFYSSLFGGYFYRSLATIIKENSVDTLQEDNPEIVPYSPKSFSDYTPHLHTNIEGMVLDRSFGNTLHYYDPSDKANPNITELTLKELLKDQSFGYDFFYNSLVLDKSKLYVGYQSNLDSHEHKLAMIENVVRFAPSIVISNLKGMVERTAGVMVDLKFMDKAASKFNEDQEFTGKYLIAEIIHSFTKNDFRQILTCKRFGSFTKHSPDQVI